jgi:hypothetical protein
MSHRNVIALSALLTAFSAFVGCSAQGTGADLTPEPVVDDPSAALPPPSQGGSGTGAAPVDGGGGSAKPKPDASTPVVANAPDEGSACTTPDEIFKRPCGACGSQEALCQFASTDAGAGVVSNYSACHDEIGSCIPGAVVAAESCGSCGTRSKTCTKYCAWNVTACTGEPVNACPAGTIAWTTAGCPVAGTFRSRECSETCGWSTFASACSGPDFRLSVPSSVGATSQIIVPLGGGIRGKRVTGSCATGATVSTDGDHAVAYVRVANTTGKKATLSAWNAQAPGAPVIDTSLVAYVAQPASDEQLKACESGAGESCATTSLPCGDYAFGSLTGSTAVVIPAGETRILAIATAAPFGTVGKITEGSVVLALRSDVLE